MWHGCIKKRKIFQATDRNIDANRRPINVSLSLRITRSRVAEPGICTCTKRETMDAARPTRLIRNKSISRPPDCRLNDSTAIQLTVSSWLSNNTRSFDEDESLAGWFAQATGANVSERSRIRLFTTTLIKWLVGVASTGLSPLQNVRRKVGKFRSFETKSIFLTWQKLFHYIW